MILTVIINKLHFFSLTNNENDLSAHLRGHRREAVSVFQMKFVRKSRNLRRISLIKPKTIIKSHRNSRGCRIKSFVYRVRSHFTKLVQKFHCFLISFIVDLLNFISLYQKTRVWTLKNF